MKKEEIRKLSYEGLKDEEDYAPTPPSGRNPPRFTLEEVDKFFKSFLIRDPFILLVGSLATQGQGADVDLVMRDADMPEILKEAVRFRLYRQFSAIFGIPYDDTPEYLHIHDEPFGSYTDWYPLYRLKVERIPNEMVHKMSLSNSDDISCEIIEKSKEFVIGGFVSDTSVDLENERLTPEALRDIWESIKKTPEKFRGLYDNHSSTCIGEMLMEYKNRKSALIGDKLYLIFKLRNDIPVAQRIIQKILNGEIRGFSIKFGIKNPAANIKQVCNKDRCIAEILGDTYYIETSVTEAPANPHTSLEILSK